MNVQVQYLYNTSIRVSWRHIDNPMIVNYTVYYLLDATSRSVMVPSSLNSVVFEDLSKSRLTDYRFQVVATAQINGDIIMGERSDIKSALIPTPQGCKPIQLGWYMYAHSYFCNYSSNRYSSSSFK